MKYATLDSDSRPIAFYTPEIHGDKIPSGAVEITEKLWRECLENPGRRRIKKTSRGNPKLEKCDPPRPSDDVLAANARARRNGLLRLCDHKALPDYPHPDDATRQAWLAYRQDLRDVPQQKGFPAKIEWPNEPQRGDHA